MADLLRLADAFPLLDRLVLLITVREGGLRKTIVFGILGGLQDHLDADQERSVEEMVEAIHGWFALRIAEEEARGHGRRATDRDDRA
jgi:hypothetical protein